jgi:hypothetical protein
MPSIKLGLGARLAAPFAVLALVLAPAAVAQPTGGGVSPPSQWNAAACSGHGHTQFGRCFCDPRWTGAACDNVEKPLDCGDHGKSSNGWCVCDPGWKGRACQTAPPPCPDGKAANGKGDCDRRP